MNSCLRVYGEHSGKCNLTNSSSDLEIFSLVGIKYFFSVISFIQQVNMVLWNFGALPSEDWARIRKLQLANNMRLQGTSAKSQVEAITVTSCLPHFPLCKILYLSQFTQFCECSTNLWLSMAYIFVNHTLEPKNKGKKGTFVVLRVVSEMHEWFLKKIHFLNFKV